MSAALVLSAAPGVAAAQAPTVGMDTVALRAAASALVEALSSGDQGRIRRFVEERFSPETLERLGGPGPMADYIGSLYIEHGPLELRASGMRTIGPVPVRLHWAYSELSGAWLGLMIDLGPDGIRRFGVQRGPTPGTLPADAPADPAGLPPYFESFLSRAADAGFFSGVVVVTHHGKTVFQGAYGMADIAAGRPMSLQTPIPLASAAKMFTAVAVGQLVQAGVLSFDDTLNKWVPEYPARIADQVTIRHLLTHTSGIEMDDDPGFHEALRNATSMEDILAAHLEYLPHMNDGRFQNFHPLDHYDYTNEGIDLLGLIVERASGTPWHEYLKRHIFEPAGMRATTAHLLRPVPDLVHGYTFREVVDRRMVYSPRWNPAPPMEELRYRPAGSSVATAGDAARFMDALFDGTLLSPALVEEMTSRQVAIVAEQDRWYGFGFMRWTADGIASIGHLGGAPGMSTLIEHYPDLGYTVVVLSNHDGGYLGASTRIRGAIATAHGLGGDR